MTERREDKSIPLRFFPWRPSPSDTAIARTLTGAELAQAEALDAALAQRDGGAPELPVAGDRRSAARRRGPLVLAVPGKRERMVHGSAISSPHR